VLPEGKGEETKQGQRSHAECGQYWSGDLSSVETGLSKRAAQTGRERHKGYRKEKEIGPGHIPGAGISGKDWDVA
jgi:hypothetical protein